MIFPLDPDYVPSPITSARLEVSSWYALLGNLHELRVEVDATGHAHITGDGYSRPTAERFVALILDWVAEVVPAQAPAVAPGRYFLEWPEGKGVVVRTAEGVVPWGDGVAEIRLHQEYERPDLPGALPR